MIDHLGNVRNDILYYTERTYPGIVVMEDTISFWDYRFGDTSLVDPKDTLRRIDMSFVCKGDRNDSNQISLSCGQIRQYEESSDHLNYYLPHFGTSGITNVKGYARIVYEDVFPNINFHLYSNARGPKMYFEIKPGGDPNDIKMLFSGQDSISTISSTLSMYLGAWQLPLAPGYAYQISGGTTSMLGWTPVWIHSGGGLVTISTSTYDPTKTLVIGIGNPPPSSSGIANLDWSVYYGDVGRQHAGRLTSEEDEKAIYHGMTQYALSFPSENGETQPSTTVTIGDWYLSKFINTERKWATYYGGTNVDQLSGVKVLYRESNPDIGGLWAVGYTRSYDVFESTYLFAGAFKQTIDAGAPTPGDLFPQDGLMASFDRLSGELKFNTYFGSKGQDFIGGIDITPDNQYLYIVGGTSEKTLFANSALPQTTGRFPLYSGPLSNYYFKGAKVNDEDHEAFIARFNLSSFTLDWSTLFGGEGFDEITSIKALGGHLYIGGRTSVQKLDEYPSPTISHSVDRFPLSQKTGAFFQNSIHSIHKSNAFIAHFDQALRLDWSTLLGHSIAGVHGLDTDSKGNILVLNSKVKSDLFAPSSPIGNSFGWVPTFDNGISYFDASSNPNQRAALLKFNSNFELKWATKLHSFGTGFTSFDPVGHVDALKIDEKDIVYIATSMDINAAPTYNLIGGYWQVANASATTSGSVPYHFDNYLLSFDNNGYFRWGTYFGGASTSTSGDSYDVATDLTINNGYLYLTGVTRCENSPYIYCPYSFSYCDMTYNATDDVFISRFKTLIEPTHVNDINPANIDLALYPNPVQDVFSVSFFNNGDLDVGSEFDIQIVSIEGKVISSSKWTIVSGVNQFQIDASGLSNGHYFIHLFNAQNNGAIKFVKL